MLQPTIMTLYYQIPDYNIDMQIHTKYGPQGSIEGLDKNGSGSEYVYGNLSIYFALFGVCMSHVSANVSFDNIITIIVLVYYQYLHIYCNNILLGKRWKSSLLCIDQHMRTKDQDGVKFLLFDCLFVC